MRVNVYPMLIKGNLEKGLILLITKNYMLSDVGSHAQTPNESDADAHLRVAGVHDQAGGGCSGRGLTGTGETDKLETGYGF